MQLSHPQPAKGAAGINPQGNLEPSLSPSISSLVSPRDRPTQKEGTQLLPLQVVKKSCYPRWNETFEFELAEPAGEKLCVEVWDWDLVGRNDFLGKVSPKPFQCCRVLPSCTPSPLLPSPPGGVQHPGAGSGRAGGRVVQAVARQIQTNRT